MQLAVSDGTTALVPERDFGWNFTLRLNIITGYTVQNFPHVQKSEPFSSTLERHKRSFFQTFPVIKVMAASNSGGECSLDTF